jgi:membrane-bound lytic murein transglycosylase D
MNSSGNVVFSPSTMVVKTTLPEIGDREYRFQSGFRIGRSEECEVSLNDQFVSRVHAEVVIEDGEWFLRDLNSSNGIYRGDQLVQRVAINEATTVRLGIRGPEISLTAFLPPRPKPNEEISRYAEHYFGKSAAGTAGEHTMMIRTAFAQVQRKQRRTYTGIIVTLAVLVTCIGGFAIYEHEQVKKQKSMATDIFYAMKALDVDVATLQMSMQNSGSPQSVAAIRSFQDRRQQMEGNYDRFLSTLRVYDPKMSEQDRLILRVARIFGECELDMPADFKTEVTRYIKYWQSSDRLEKDISLAKQNGYTQTITKELLAEGLPPQFFYLALQESNFDPYISGPATRSGIAKGMWQFVPQTAVKYGLHLGPLVDLRRPDPGDDRHHYDRETVAAGKYLKDLYSTDAQASGLLVMACYNWGEIQVLPIVRSMPLNPRERNFWMLLRKHRDQIPQETYDYVFYIVSAAVIGENPRLFGFNFDNPLADLESK